MHAFPVLTVENSTFSVFTVENSTLPCLAIHRNLTASDDLHYKSNMLFCIAQTPSHDTNEERDRTQEKQIKDKNKERKEGRKLTPKHHPHEIPLDLARVCVALLV